VTPQTAKIEPLGYIWPSTQENVTLQFPMKNTRRKHTDAFKTEVVLEAIKEPKTLAKLAQFERTTKLNEHENSDF